MARVAILVVPCIVRTMNGVIFDPPFNLPFIRSRRVRNHEYRDCFYRGPQLQRRGGASCGGLLVAGLKKLQNLEGRKCPTAVFQLRMLLPLILQLQRGLVAGLQTRAAVPQ